MPNNKIKTKRKNLQAWIEGQEIEDLKIVIEYYSKPLNMKTEADVIRFIIRRLADSIKSENPIKILPII